MAEKKGSMPRRKFIISAGAGMAAASVLPTILKGNTEVASKTLNIGVVGLGGRGSGAVLNALRADPNTRLTAIAEVFGDRLENGLRNVINAVKNDSTGKLKPEQIAVKHKFTGFDGYKKLMETDVDVVILTTSPHFRPLHAEEAVNKGKHVFAEKPLATDPVGLRNIAKTIKKAKDKNLSFLTGFCFRFDAGKVECMRRIHAGEIGKVVNVQAQYNAGGVWYRTPKPDWTQMDNQMRNWYYYTWLSGDHIVEQAVHNMDKLTWAMGDIPPIACLGFGSRQQRIDAKYGNIFDNFSIQYEYPDKVYGNVICRHQQGTDGGVGDIVRGSEGFCDVMGHRISGKTNWRWNTKKDGRIQNMYDVEHVHLFEGIRSGKVVNNGDSSIISCGIAIMGRMSAYTGKKIYWDHVSKPSLMQSKLDLSPPAYKWGDIEMRPVAQPGKTPYI